MKISNSKNLFLSCCTIKINYQIIDSKEIFTRVVKYLAKVSVIIEPDELGLEYQNWIQIKGNHSSSFIITVSEYTKFRVIVGIVFLQIERLLKLNKIDTYPSNIFRNKLVEYITRLRSADHEVILVADIMRTIIIVN